jgi:hypothetical protein
MAIVLTLGPLLFTDFEVPEHISVGGKQILVVHKLVGGDRVIDAMGRDDSDIKWSGRFRGSAAEIRARLADFLRVQGQPLILAWSSYRYLVMVDFEADYLQPYEIPYTITCTVVSDLTSPILTALLDIDSAIFSDVNQLIQVGAALNVPGITTAIGGVSSATGAVATFQGAASSDVTGVTSAIGVAQAAIAGQTATQNALVAPSGSVAGAVAGDDPADIATNLTGQAGAFQQLGVLYQAKALLGRISTNIMNAGP